MSIPRSGTQYDIVHGSQRAVVTEVGATLRGYSVDGRDIVTTFDEDAMPFGCQGQQLLPWPNRIRDGRYTWRGVEHQLPINEHDRHNALHGLLSWVPWQVTELYPSLVRLRTTVFPQPGWPGSLQCEVTHELGAGGLTVELAVTNLGSEPAPFGYAAHPYFSFGEPIDGIHVEVPFTQWLATDDRLLPVELRPLTDGPLTGGPLGEATYDTAFATPRRDDAGHWHVRLSQGDHTTTIWGDASMGWLQLYTPADRLSLAVEPMTCGPDAFNEGPTHDGVITIDPRDTFTCRWGIQPR